MAQKGKARRRLKLMEFAFGAPACGTSLLWDAAALLRRMPLVWCAQIGFQSPVLYAFCCCESLRISMLVQWGVPLSSFEASVSSQ
jgi:hypothetical protein